MYQMIRRIALWLETIFYFVLSFKGSKACIKNADETVEMICKGKSIIRLGDGEFGIFRDEDIHYQKCSPELKVAFERIKKDYIEQSGECKYILAVPNVFMKCSGMQLLRRREYVAAWSRARWDFIHKFPQDKIVYGDAFIFEKRNRCIYSRIWKEPKCIVFVHNSREYVKNFAKTYQVTPLFVQCPPYNAFESLEDIKTMIRKVVLENGYKIEDVMVIISAGPAAKILVYDLCKENYQCIDAGHCWDEPLEGM